MTVVVGGGAVRGSVDAWLRAHLLMNLKIPSTHRGLIIN